MTRQAYYQHHWNMEERGFEDGLVVSEVLRIRNGHPRMGCRKLYGLLEPFMLEHGIKMGRDALFDLLAAHHLLVRRRKRAVHTTNSPHWLRKYPNLAKGLVPTGPNQLWVSDITYWKAGTGFLYISFITDAFSHKIVGFHVAGTLEAVASVRALEQPVEGLVHHSGRGIQ